MTVGYERWAIFPFVQRDLYLKSQGNMMLAWPGSEREASDDFFFVLTR